MMEQLLINIIIFSLGYYHSKMRNKQFSSLPLTKPFSLKEKVSLVFMLFFIFILTGLALG
ncbi:hypothetical protein SM124_11540 [Bacillus sp. 31A1R]|uniref:Uncharacterized protein n=1 Tax=Robertmurraya mangrovi TaxID=3098077 RepID=A0ABU5IZ37_9BACI|nr:hypothetical protein [Bacillus sp. 31A1R]MDZ5472381.1 hypothetical protein [Bacillus sp. 31A1R]